MSIKRIAGAALACVMAAGMLVGCIFPAVLIKKACGIETASGTPNKKKVAKITSEQVRKIAETKMPDLNAASVEAAMSMVAGTARSMGIEVVD